MNLSKFYDRISRKTDTSGTKINVAETKRVLACYYDELAGLPTDEVIATVASGLRLARKRAAQRRKGCR